MGIIKAISGAVGGGLADSWLEVIEADNMGNDTVMTTGKFVRNDPRSSNTKGTSKTISNGSIIHVYPEQMVILSDNGKVVDYSAEEGTFQVSTSSLPSLFNGNLGESVKETFNRIKFAGTPSSAQVAYFINLQEIRNIRFGTPAPINYYDETYDADLMVTCHGSFSIKITDPLKFYKECCPRNKDRVTVDDIFAQYGDEFLTALQTAIAKLSVEGYRISHLSAKADTLAKELQDCLDESWTELRGFEIVKVAIPAITYTDESTEIMQMRSKGAMLKKADIREGFVQGSVAKGLEAAGSNSGGAGAAFMGMGMGMNAGGLGSFSATNAQQMEIQRQQEEAKKSADTWKCSCGADSTGKFCSECGLSRPAPEGSWKCACGALNTGKYCAECGVKKPDDGVWTCSKCGAENTSGKFCSECGTSK